jgi:MFS family permease
MLLRSYFGLLAFGTAYGVLNASFGVGGLFGPAIAGYLYDATGSYFWGFLFTSLILLIGRLIRGMKTRMSFKRNSVSPKLQQQSLLTG